MILRSYKNSDCKELINLFYNTVHTVNAKDYTSEQLDVWAPKNIDLRKWDYSFRRHTTVVAIEDNKIVGFGDIDRSGYLDRLFVDKNYQNQGIATALCEELEASVEGKRITTHASITAKPFFEHRGYHLIKEQKVLRNGIELINFVMEK
ncbi:GNAT family N-acetyltransferase [uncultured Lactobacillus sp.]|uniref:GNAT family N-acetyltransferase n=1 Tax=uncultured Lactobacillus sp. TaxID=153152 RepID=UPI00260EE565|nr:GNAT family N-acetyltransferase [uncultured Lactobacillus sp.]